MSNLEGAVSGFLGEHPLPWVRTAEGLNVRVADAYGAVFLVAPWGSSILDLMTEIETNAWQEPEDTPAAPVPAPLPFAASLP